LKAQWADEHVNWSRRDLSKSRCVYWWADGIHTGPRSENSDGQPAGDHRRGAGWAQGARRNRDGYRESKASWQELLLDLKSRGL